MGAGHAHSDRRPAWGHPASSVARRLLDRARGALGIAASPARIGLRELPLALRRGELAEAYLAAEAQSDHGRAAAAAVASMERAASNAEWWTADLWAHRALWHFEKAGLTLQSARQARRIGDLRAAAGDPASARRYYAEAIDEARDIGAEHEQGLAALGLGRSLMELGQVTAARRLGAAALDLLGRAGAPTPELEAAGRLLGTEVVIGERTREDG